MIELVLNLEVYGYEKIKTAIFDYQNYADITSVESKDSIILRFNNCKFDESLTVKEFECYLIGLENS